MGFLRRTLNLWILATLLSVSGLASAGYELRGVVNTYEPASGYAVIDGERYALHSNLKVYASPRSRQANSKVTVSTGMRVGYTLSYDAANRASLTGVWVLSR